MSTLDLISRADAIKAVEKYYADHKYFTRSRTTLSAICEDMKGTINALPSAQRAGKWIPDNLVGGGYWVCTACKHPTEAFGADKLYKWCPFCGARMVEE